MKSPDESGPAASVPHATSMAIWGMPPSAVVGKPARISIGVQCAGSCSLTGETVEVCNSSGQVLARGTLAPQKGRDGMFGAALEIPMPDQTGVAFFSARFTPPAGEKAHLGCEASFSLRIDLPPDHHVTVRVIDEMTSKPAPDVETWVGRYVAHTDAAGMAQFHVPAGTYTCTVRQIGHQADPVEVRVLHDLVQEIRLQPGLTREAFEERQSSMESYPWG